MRRRVRYSLLIAGLLGICSRVSAQVDQQIMMRDASGTEHSVHFTGSIDGGTVTGIAESDGNTYQISGVVNEDGTISTDVALDDGRYLGTFALGAAGDPLAVSYDLGDAPADTATVCSVTDLSAVAPRAIDASVQAIDAGTDVVASPSDAAAARKASRDARVAEVRAQAAATTNPQP